MLHVQLQPQRVNIQMYKSTCHPPICIQYSSVYTALLINMNMVTVCMLICFFGLGFFLLIAYILHQYLFLV